MRYLKFRVRNFKGIRDTEIDLRSSTGANVFTLVGLNESGKTTILEAIHSFSPDYRTRTLRGTKSKLAAEAAKERLPRHLLAHFTGEISVTATVEVTEEDKENIAELIKNEDNIIINSSDIPNVFDLERSDRFERGDYIETNKSFSFDLFGKKKGDRKAKSLSRTHSDIYDSIWMHAPDIAYHDSFIFDFPKRIYLTARPGAGDWVYREMFQDVLAAGRVKYTLDDITRRIKNEKYKKNWFNFFTDWSAADDKDRVQQIIDQASETVTKAVFGKWNKIFREEVGDKEISVQFGVEKGRVYDKETKTYADCDDHDLYVSLEIKNGVKRFPIQDRSLGFRWFFAFLLFTEFRTKRSDDRAVLFLFDEPAANLHSAAQERLIESFPEIATGDNMLIYSTHSHYMISPDWLEQTFIVTNAADAPGGSVVDSAVLEDDSLDVKAQLYRAFANEHPSDTSYFQPIIDRIEVVPSKFDISIPSVILEGKSDFYILRYASLLSPKISVRLVPGTGSGTFDALIGIGATWGTKFVFLLDSDNAGIKERERYALERGARANAIFSISDFLVGVTEIEDILDQEARAIIKNDLGKNKVSKKDIMRFFQERLAKRDIVPLGKAFSEKTEIVLSGLDNSMRLL